MTCGRVYLVGAGPGDPGLISARALEVIGAADVVLYDRLIPGAALDGARPDAELVYVGKEGWGPSEGSGAGGTSGGDGRGGVRSVPQEETEALMVARARAGKVVVRLKGGDPFVFGRGGEEAGRLLEARIPFEVVPGITAGLAAPAYAGIPVTYRGRASAVALVTGHEDPGKDAPVLDWAGLAGFPGTLVFYMGVRALPAIAEALIAAGRPPAQPAAAIECGTLPRQRTVSGTLATIAERAAGAGLRPPAVTVVGAVADLAEALGWYERLERPLAGRTVAVTRARAQASGLAGRLEELGARVVQAPSIRIRALPGPPLDPSGYDLVCLTSANGVEALFDRLAGGGRDARALAGCRVAAIGAGTAAALRRHGIVADVVPERFVAEGLIEALDEAVAAQAGGPQGAPAIRRALVARAREGRDTLPEALRARGAQVEVAALYETVAEPLPAPLLEAATRADYVTFTSSSTVRFFFAALGAERAQAGLSATTRLVSIGPITSQALRDHGVEPHVEAARHDIDGVLEALLTDAAAQTQAGPGTVSPGAASGAASPGPAPAQDAPDGPAGPRRS